MPTRRRKTKTTFSSVPLKRIGFVLLGGIIVLQFVLLGVLFSRFQHYKRDTDTVIGQLTLDQNVGLHNVGLLRVTAVPAENIVYLPDIHLKLPLNESTLGLVYGKRTTESNGKSMDVVDVTTLTDATTEPFPNQRLACVPVRLAFEDKANPYNPHEIAQLAVKLGDGRTLQIYKFQDDSCNGRWQITQTDPAKIAEAFQSAKSY